MTEPLPSELSVDPDLPKHKGDWVFRVSLVLVMGLVTFFVIIWGQALFATTAANLPLLLPLVVTVLSISTRGGDIRTVESVLKISNDIAIGIVSFDIWALLASRSDSQGRILVDTKTMISGDFAIPFLLSGLVLTVGCVVLTHYPFKSTLVKKRCLFAALLFSIVAYIAPFSVRQDIPPFKPSPPPSPVSHAYTVVIPYQDPGITAVAPSFLSSRNLVHIERQVSATTSEDAKALGIQRFMALPESTLVRNREAKVAVRAQDVLAVEQDPSAALVK